MNRRDFLTLAVKVAGAVVLLPRIELPDAPFVEHFDHEHMKRRMLNGLFHNAEQQPIRAALVTSRGTFAFDGVDEVGPTKAGDFYIRFKPFLATCAFTTPGFVLLDGAKEVARKRFTSERWLVAGDQLILTYTMRIS